MKISKAGEAPFQYELCIMQFETGKIACKKQINFMDIHLRSKHILDLFTLRSKQMLGSVISRTGSVVGQKFCLVKQFTSKDMDV